MHSLLWEVGGRLICASTQVRASWHSSSAGNHQINIPPPVCLGKSNLCCVLQNGVFMHPQISVAESSLHSTPPSWTGNGCFYVILRDIIWHKYAIQGAGFKCLSCTAGNMEHSVISPMKSWFYSQIRWSRPTNILREPFLWSKSLRCVSDTSLLRHFGLGYFQVAEM